MNAIYYAQCQAEGGVARFDHVFIERLSLDAQSGLLVAGLRVVMKDYTPEEAVFAQQRGEEIGFDTPEEVIEFARRGGQVDNACLRHAFQDLPRPTPEEAVEQQRAGHTPIIGFAFDTPAEIIEFCRLGWARQPRHQGGGAGPDRPGRDLLHGGCARGGAGMTRDTYDRLEDRCSMVTASIDHGHTEGRRLENVWRPHGHTTLLRVMQASRAGDVCLTDIEAAHRGVMESLEQNEECKAAYGACGVVAGVAGARPRRTVRAGGRRERGAVPPGGETRWSA